MRVLFCTLDYPPSAAGGAEQQARLQAESLVRRGHRVDVVCARTPGHASGEIGGVRVHRLHRIEIKYLRTISYLAMLALYLVLQIRRFDLLHVHLANLQADVAVAIAKRVGCPTYLKLAAGGPLGEIGRLKAIAWLTRYYGIRRADAVQAISDEIAQDVQSIGVDPARVVRIPNGVVVPLRAAREERVAARQILGLDPGDMIVLYAGRMERDKGIEDLLHAWKALGLTAGRLLLVGRPGINSPVSLKHLPQTVEHRAWTDRPDRYLAAADIFVLPSYGEGMSNALLEAMAAGLPCVSTHVGAAPEMIDDGASGILVRPGDRAGLVAALRDLANSEARRQSLGDCARTSIAASYGIERVVDRIERAYQSITGDA
jgi:glycosyltransferase involved in cell wall biosynthesis